jgi:Ca-activated chloride channel family protein
MPTAPPNTTLGNALYKSDKKEEALTAYEKAQSQMTNYGERSNALYNKGVVLQNDKKLEDCIVAYKNALKLDPNNVDARHNLQLALKKQQQEKQKQDQDKKDKDDKIRIRIKNLTIRTIISSLSPNQAT